MGLCTGCTESIAQVDTPDVATIVLDGRKVPVVGFLAGAIPGVGPTNATFIDYAMEKRISKNPDTFGNGALEGVAGPGAAGHAGTVAGMVAEKPLMPLSPVSPTSPE